MLAKAVPGVSGALLPSHSKPSDEDIAYDYGLIYQPELEHFAFYESGVFEGFLSLENLVAIYAQREEALMACEVCDFPSEANQISDSTGQTFLPLITAPKPSLADLTSDMPAMFVSPFQNALDYVEVLTLDTVRYDLGMMVEYPIIEDTAALSISSTNIEDSPEWGKQIGRYYIRLSIHKHYIGSCIGRDVNHLNFELQRLRWNGWRWVLEYTITNIHLAAWWQSGKPCFGYYESRYGYCRKWCSPVTWNNLYYAIAGALAIYIGYQLAYAFASLAAAPALGALIVIPGVPPPP